KEPGQRRRFCPECYAKLNMKQLYGEVPRNAPDLWSEVTKSLPRPKTETGRMSAKKSNKSSEPGWFTICGQCGTPYNGAESTVCPKCGV
ncbi:MAG: hypothetical protein ACWGQW_23035, partial [bacterium]